MSDKKHREPGFWGVARIVEGDLCFLDDSGCFQELCVDTHAWFSRNEAYTAAREYRGLVCYVPHRLLLSYGLSLESFPSAEDRATA